MTDTTKCSECGETLSLSPGFPHNKRSPCPCCGSKQRTFDVSITESVVVSDHAAALGVRVGNAFAFRESRRADGRAASADLEDDGSLSYLISGSSPQGEDETLRVCKLLIRSLNLDGSTWSEPEPGHGVVDCEATNINDRKQRLQVQIVRANTNQNLWRQLNTQGEAYETKLGPRELASILKNAIDKKAATIPQSVKRGLVLALDATLLPHLAFEAVTAEFKLSHSQWAGELGFDAIWLVGPVSELIQRLDR